jgi:hypothetical protein
MLTNMWIGCGYYIKPRGMISGELNKGSGKNIYTVEYT